MEAETGISSWESFTPTEAREKKPRRWEWIIGWPGRRKFLEGCRSLYVGQSR